MNSATNFEPEPSYLPGQTSPFQQEFSQIGVTSDCHVIYFKIAHVNATCSTGVLTTTTTKKIETPVLAVTAASATAAGTLATQRSLTETTGTKFMKLFFLEIHATAVVFILGQLLTHKMLFFYTVVIMYLAIWEALQKPYLKKCKFNIKFKQTYQ